MPILSHTDLIQLTLPETQIITLYKRTLYKANIISVQPCSIKNRVDALVAWVEQCPVGGSKWRRYTSNDCNIFLQADRFYVDVVPSKTPEGPPTWTWLGHPHDDIRSAQRTIVYPDSGPSTSATAPVSATAPTSTVAPTSTTLPDDTDIIVSAVRNALHDALQSTGSIPSMFNPDEKPMYLALVDSIGIFLEELGIRAEKSTISRLVCIEKAKLQPNPVQQTVVQLQQNTVQQNPDVQQDPVQQNPVVQPPPSPVECTHDKYKQFTPISSINAIRNDESKSMKFLYKGANNGRIFWNKAAPPKVCRLCTKTGGPYMLVNDSNGMFMCDVCLGIFSQGKLNAKDTRVCCYTGTPYPSAEDTKLEFQLKYYGGLNAILKGMNLVLEFEVNNYMNSACKPDIIAKLVYVPTGIVVAMYMIELDANQHQGRERDNTAERLKAAKAIHKNAEHVLMIRLSQTGDFVVQEGEDKVLYTSDKHSTRERPTKKRSVQSGVKTRGQLTKHMPPSKRYAISRELLLDAILFRDMYPEFSVIFVCYNSNSERIAQLLTPSNEFIHMNASCVGRTHRFPKPAPEDHAADWGSSPLPACKHFGYSDPPEECVSRNEIFPAGFGPGAKAFGR